MLAHFTKMAFKAMTRFKLHSVISQLSLIIGFLCFIAAIILSQYASSFDQQFPNAGNIYNLISRTVGDSPAPDKFPIVNEPTSRYLRAEFPEIPNIASATPGFPQDVTIGDQSIALDTKYVEDRFFSIFELETLHGLATGESLPPNSVMLTEAGAMKAFGRTDVVGERLLIGNRDDVVVAGVAKSLEQPSHLESSVALFNVEMYVPMSIQEAGAREARVEAGVDPDADQWGNQSYYVYLEFPEEMEMTVEEFNQRLDEFVKARLPEELVEVQTFQIQPISQLVPSQLAFLTGGFDLTDILIVAGALVLMIGCLNYSNLIIAQLSLRSQEIGVQKILGSKRSLLVIQYCYESLLFIGLALLFTVLILILALASLGNGGMVGVSPAMLLDPSLWTTLLPAIIIIVLLAGGYPALRTAVVPLVSMMRPKGSSGYSGRLRSIMVGVQFFISGTLMILAVVMFIQNGAMTQQLDGDRLDPKIIVSVPIDTYTVDHQLLINELERDPSIVSVSQVGRLPWEIGSNGTSFSRTADLTSAELQMGTHTVGYNFSRTMDMPLTSGREFSRDRNNDVTPNLPELLGPGGPYSVIIDDLAAQSFGFEDADAAVGQTVYRRIGPPSIEREAAIEYVVIGAMSERKYDFIDFSSFGNRGHIYLLRPEVASFLAIKASRENLQEALQHIDSTWSKLMPTIALTRQFVDDLFYASYGMFLGISLAIGSLSIFGFLVASIGLLGNATFITNIRQKEVGIRKVMGASSATLLRMLLLDFAKPIIIANALAWPLGYFIGTLYTNMLAAKADITLLPFIVSLGLSVLIAFSAVISQSWKSARVRPASVLRYE